jgi:hypothetical protein
MASPFPFTAGQVLTAAELNTFGNLTSYTPTFTNVTVGNGTLDFKYSVLNNICIVEGTFTLGSTSAVGGGGAIISLPVASVALAGLPIYGICLHQDATGDAFSGTVSAVNTTTVRLNRSAVSGTNIVQDNISSLSPFTWTTSDRMHASFWYEIA